MTIALAKIRSFANSLAPIWCRLHWLLLAGVYGFIAYKSVYKGGVMWAFDFYSYHITVGPSKWGLEIFSKVPENVAPHPLLTGMMDFMVPLIYYVQNVLLLITGKFWYMNLSTSLFIWFTCFALYKLEGERVSRWTMTALLGLPAYIINAPSGLTDIASSLMILLAALMLIRILRGDSSRRLAALFYAFTFAGLLCKLQMWYPGFLMIGIHFCWVQYRMWRDERVKVFSVRRFYPLLISIAIVSFWPIKNYVTIGEPVAPMYKLFYIKHAAKTLLLEGPAAARKFMEENQNLTFRIRPLFTPDIVKSTSNMARYFYSFYELSRFLTDKPMMWSSSGWHGGSDSPHQMSGGLNGFYMALATLALLALIYQRAIPGAALFTLGILMLMTANLVQSHEMRYWLYVPFILLTLLVIYAPKARYGRTIVYGAILIGGFSTWSHHDMKINDVFGLNAGLFQYYPEIPKFWREHTPNTPDTIYCLPKSDRTEIVVPMAATFTGKNLRTFYVRDCSQDAPVKSAGAKKKS